MLDVHAGGKLILLCDFVFVVGLEQKGLSKRHLQDAMGKLEPPIKFRQSDKMEVLIKNIIESMSTREVAPRLKGGVLRAADTIEDDLAAVHTEKKRRVDVQKTLDLLPHRTAGLEGKNTVVGPHTERSASDEETGAFGSQHLACVLSAAVASLKDMKERVAYVKMTSDVFKAGVPLSCKSDGAYSKVQIAESIAKCRPGGVTTAHELLTWLMVSAAK